MSTYDEWKLASPPEHSDAPPEPCPHGETESCRVCDGSEIMLGALVFFATFAGNHVHVVVRGAGNPGQRPLLGNLTMTVAEWDSLLDSVYRLTITPLLRCEEVGHV